MSASTVNISSAADLIALAEYVNTHSENKNDYSATAGKTFVLTTDIDLNPGMDVTALKEGEKPVVWDGIRTFGGTFEGNSHTIKGDVYKRQGGNREYRGYRQRYRWRWACMESRYHRRQKIFLRSDI